MKAETANGKYKEALKFIDSKNFEKAVEALDIVVEASPTFFDAVYKRAECLLALGKTEKASFDLRRASRLEPLNMKVLLQLAEVLLYQGEHDDGLGSVAKCVQMNEDMVWILYSIT